MASLTIPNACTSSASEPVGTTTLEALSCNMKTIDEVVNSTADSTTNRVGDNVLTIEGLSKKFGFIIVGDFATGFTIESRNQVGQAVDGTIWRYTGTLPLTVTAGTVPSSPVYEQILSTDHDLLTNLDGDGHDGIYSRIFASVDAMLSYQGLQVGQRYSTGGTTWEYEGFNVGTIADFKPLTSLFVNDYGAKGDGIADDTLSIKNCIADAKLLSANIDFMRTDNYYRLTETVLFGHKAIVNGNLATLSIEHSTGDGVKVATAIQFENFSIVVRSDAFSGWALNLDDSFDSSDRHYPSQLHVNNIYLDSDTTTYNANMLRFSPAANYGGKVSRVFLGRGRSNYSRRCNNAFLWYQTNAQWGTSNVISEVYVDMNIQGDYWKMYTPDLGLGAASSNELHSIVLQARGAGTTPSLYGYLFNVDGFTNLRVSNFKVFDYNDGSQYAKPIYFNNCSNAEFSMSPDVDFTRLSSELIEIGSSTLSKIGYSTKSANATVNTRFGSLVVDAAAGFAKPYFFPTGFEWPLQLEIRSRTDFAKNTRPLIARVSGHGYQYLESLTYQCLDSESADRNPIHKIQLFREGVVVWFRQSTVYLSYECYGPAIPADGLTYTNTAGSPVTVVTEASTSGLGRAPTPVYSTNTISAVPVTFATSAELLSAASRVNTVGKALGNSVLVTNTVQTVISSGTSPTANWRFSDGTVAYTPV